MQLSYRKTNFRSACSISCALEIIGDKWTLLIIRDIMFGKSKSFGEFLSSPEKIASNILSKRLEKLVSHGILEKTVNNENRLKFDYELTEMGKELEPVIRAIGEWGHEAIKGTVSVESFLKLDKPLKK